MHTTQTLPRPELRGDAGRPRGVESHERGSQATFFAVSVLVGAFSLGITDSLPGGWSGGAGFLAGFAATFLCGVVLSVVIAYRGEGPSPGAEPGAASGVEPKAA